MRASHTRAPKRARRHVRAGASRVRHARALLTLIRARGRGAQRRPSTPSPRPGYKPPQHASTHCSPPQQPPQQQPSPAHASHLLAISSDSSGSCRALRPHRARPAVDPVSVINQRPPPATSMRKQVARCPAHLLTPATLAAGRSARNTHLFPVTTSTCCTVRLRCADNTRIR